MVDWGVVHYWINTFILGVLGLAVLAHSRWRRYIWFVCYALIASASTVIYLLFFYTHPFYLAKIVVTNLLVLGAVVELVRRESGSEPLWSWGALLCLVVVPFLPIDWNLRYALAPFCLYAGQAFSLGIAVRSGNILLIGMSVMGLSYFAATIFKLFSEFQEFWSALRYLDPWFFTIVVSLMLMGIYLPHIVRAFRKMASSIANWGLRLRPLEAVAAQTPASRSPLRIVDQADVHTFPPAERLDSEDGLSQPGALRFLMDEVLERFDSMEEALAVAATISMSTRKTFLSLSDLAVYLGVDEEVADKFVEHRKIAKIQLTDDAKDWVVARSTVDEVLSEAL